MKIISPSLEMLNLQSILIYFLEITEYMKLLPNKNDTSWFDLLKINKSSHSKAFYLELVLSIKPAKNVKLSDSLFKMLYIMQKKKFITYPIKFHLGIFNFILQLMHLFFDIHMLLLILSHCNVFLTKIVLRAG